jgi:hypothetical protein
MCYVNPGLARKVNVEATSTLVNAAAAEPKPPRFVQASSIATYGPRNPHRTTEPLTPDTPVRAFDIYGGHKVEAEHLVRGSALTVILRLGGVMTTEFSLGMGPDMLYFEGLLPSDGGCRPWMCATSRTRSPPRPPPMSSGRCLIGGDDTHRQVQGEVGPAITAAMGLVGAMAKGRKGNPADDDAWFATDRMDSPSPGVAGLPASLVARHSQGDRGERRLEAVSVPGGRPAGPRVLKRQSPYYRQPGQYADPWGAVKRKWGRYEADNA